MLQRFGGEVSFIHVLPLFYLLDCCIQLRHVENFFIQQVNTTIRTTGGGFEPAKYRPTRFQNHVQALVVVFFA